MDLGALLWDRNLSSTLGLPTPLQPCVAQSRPWCWSQVCLAPLSWVVLVVDSGFLCPVVLLGKLDNVSFFTKGSYIIDWAKKKKVQGLGLWTKQVLHLESLQLFLSWRRMKTKAWRRRESGKCRSPAPQELCPGYEPGSKWLAKGIEEGDSILSSIWGLIFTTVCLIICSCHWTFLWLYLHL